MAASSGMQCHQECDGLERVTEDAARILAVSCAVVIAGVLRNFSLDVRKLPIAIMNEEREVLKETFTGDRVGRRPPPPGLGYRPPAC
jgi:hypothetical protein